MWLHNFNKSMDLTSVQKNFIQEIHKKAKYSYLIRKRQIE